MSHPHDGYDSIIGVDYRPGDEFFYAWTGDESHSIMGYLDLRARLGSSIATTSGDILQQSI
jgi:hypothetical protein